MNPASEKQSTARDRRNELNGIKFADVLENGGHAGLWLHAYLPEQERKSEGTDGSGDEKKAGKRGQHIQEVCKLKVPDLYRQWYCQWEHMLVASGAKMRIAKATSRISVGLGEESVLETAVSLHHTYGVPYIAGSALKGLVSSYLRQKLMRPRLKNAADTDDEKKQQYKEWQLAHTTICGNQDSAGYITFYDALYCPLLDESFKGTEDPLVYPLVPDVITVHHQKYYQETGDAPADWDSPIPIPFPSARGRYLIALDAPDLEPEESEQWVTLTFQILTAALKTMGIGAKTSSGYGRMKIEGIEQLQCIEEIKEPEVVTDPKAQRIADIIREVQSLPDNTSIKGRFDAYLQKWRQVKDHPASRDLAQAIVDKVETSGCKTSTQNKGWYQELVAFLSSF